MGIFPESVEELGAKLLVHFGLPPEISLTKFSDISWLKDLNSRIPMKEREISLLQKFVQNKDLTQCILAVLRKDTENQVKCGTGNSLSHEQILTNPSLRESREVTKNSTQNQNQIPTLTLEENAAIETIQEVLQLHSDDDLTQESKQIFLHMKKNLTSKMQNQDPLPLATACVFRAARKRGKPLDISILYSFLKQGGIKPRVFRDLLFEVTATIKSDTVAPVRPNPLTSQSFGESRRVDVSGRVRFGGNTYYVDRSWSGKDLFVQKVGNTVTVQDARGQKIAVSSKILQKAPAIPPKTPSPDPSSSKPILPGKSTPNPLASQVSRESRNVEKSGRVRFGGKTYYVDRSWGGKSLFVQEVGNTVTVQDARGQKIPVSSKILQKAPEIPPKTPSPDPSSSKPILPVESESKAKIQPDLVKSPLINPEEAKKTAEKRTYKVDNSGQVLFSGVSFQVDPAWINKTILLEKDKSQIRVYDLFGNPIQIVEII